MNWIEDVAVIRAKFSDAQRDTKQWLAIAKSVTERIYIRRMQQCIGDLQAILDRVEIRRIKLRDIPDEQGRWDNTVREFLNSYQAAAGVRGCIVGIHLSPLASQLLLIRLFQQTIKQ